MCCRKANLHSVYVLVFLGGTLHGRIRLDYSSQCVGKHSGDILFAADDLKPTVTTDDNPALH